jgi:hypothetical protein
MKEDVRETISVAETFYSIILSLYEKKEAANILYDNNGITRASGNIKQFSEENKFPYLILDNNTRININSIVAVNGTFAPDYSEC